MKNVFLALSLALTMLPVAALADDTNAPAPPPAMSDAQRQAMFKTFETFRVKEGQLYAQLRSQILGSLTPAHRTAVASMIGAMATSTNPDPLTASKQLDAILSQGEQQRILAAHTSFATQSKALHEAMRAQMASQMPAGAPGGGMREHGGSGAGMHQEMGMHSGMTGRPDAGMVLLMVLSHPEPMMPMGMGHRFGGPGGPPHS